MITQIKPCSMRIQIKHVGMGEGDVSVLYAQR
jgi:hypothetical protein